MVNVLLKNHISPLTRKGENHVYSGSDRERGKYGWYIQGDSGAKTIPHDGAMSALN
jgi:hypothetical protein